MNTHTIFGAGALGITLAQELIQHGHTVRLVNRNGQPNNAPKEAQCIAADINDIQAIKGIAQGSSVIYNCIMPPYTAQAWETQLIPLWQNIANAAQGAKLVIGDNLYMYDHTPGPISENRPMQNPTRKGQARIRAAETMQNMHNAGQTQIAFVRASNFFGPHATRQSIFGNNVFPAMLSGKTAQMIGGLDKKQSLTYLPDFARAMRIVGEHDEAFGQAWHVPNAPATTRREVLETIASFTQKPLKVAAMNQTMMTVVGLFVPALREINEMYYQFDRDYIVDSNKFIQHFGDIHTPLKTALQETTRWFKNNAQKSA